MTRDYEQELWNRMMAAILTTGLDAGQSAIRADDAVKAFKERFCADLYVDRGGQVQRSGPMTYEDALRRLKA